MEWLLEKADRLGGTIFAAIAGVVASQFQAFVQAYLQRLGGHLDEARRMGRELEASGTASGTAPTEQVTNMLQQRIAELESAIRAIEQANPYLKPFAFFTHMDAEIAAAAGANFVPAIPLDPPGIVYALVGAMLGWVVWELIKWPGKAVLSRRNPDTAMAPQTADKRDLAI